MSRNVSAGRHSQGSIPGAKDQMLWLGHPREPGGAVKQRELTRKRPNRIFSFRQSGAASRPAERVKPSSEATFQIDLLFRPTEQATGYDERKAFRAFVPPPKPQRLSP